MPKNEENHFVMVFCLVIFNYDLHKSHKYHPYCFFVCFCFFLFLYCGPFAFLPKKKVCFLYFTSHSTIKNEASHWNSRSASVNSKAKLACVYVQGTLLIFLEIVLISCHDLIKTQQSNIICSISVWGS